MAKAAIETGQVAQPVHTRTTAGVEESQVVVLGVDGSDAVVDPRDLATQTTLAALNAKVPAAPAADGSDGATPPTIPGTGIRGWLRSIYDRLAGTLTIGGTVAVSNLPATQPVSGSVSVGNFPATQPVSAAALPLPVGAAQEHATAASPASVRLSDGTSYLGSTAGRLQVADGGVALAVSGPVTDAQLRASAVATSLASALPAGENAIGTVDLAAASPTAIVDGATAIAAKYIGVTLSETSGTATAKIRVRNQNATGAILDTITLLANESVSYTYPRGRAAASGTVYVEVVSGAVEGSVFTL